MALNNIKTWWQQKNSRERLMLSLLIVTVVGASLYKVILEPIVGGYLQAKDRYGVVDHDYRWLQDQRGVLSKIRSQAGGVLSVSRSAMELKKIVDKSLAKEKIKVESTIIKKDGVELIVIEFEGVASNKMMSWLEGLIRQGTKLVEIEAKNNNSRLYGKFIVQG